MPGEMTPDEDEWETAPPGSAAGYDRLMEDYSALRKNRWAAFTDDELRDLAEVTENGPIRLGQEIRSELERRRS